MVKAPRFWTLWSWSYARSWLLLHTLPKATISQFQFHLNLYVDLIAKTKGLAIAQKFLRKVDPNFNTMDSNAKKLALFDR
ncbi:hypothetical protein YC2023_089762 [Brassica napus]